MASNKKVLNNPQKPKKGLALTIGINSVDQNHYQELGDLNACENDAKAYAEIAESMNFQVETLLTEEATRENVIAKISNAANELKAGDIFMMCYSGHGGQIPDMNGDEEDSWDETMCLYDGQLVDDELYAQLAKFAEGVRVLVFSDSCHSGTIVKDVAGSDTKIALQSPPPNALIKSMPSTVGMRVYNKNKAFYDKILKDENLKDKEKDIKASVLLISGCQDNQGSYVYYGAKYSNFTSQLLYLWKEGVRDKNYSQFYDEICGLMPNQKPNYYRIGKKDPKFEQGKVFEI